MNEKGSCVGNDQISSAPWKAQPVSLKSSRRKLVKKKKKKIRKQPREQNALKAIIYPAWPWALPWSHFFPTWTGFEHCASECMLLGEGWGSGCRGGEWSCLPTNVEDLQLSYSSCQHNLLHVINRRTGLLKPLSKLQSWDWVMRTIWSLFTLGFSKTRDTPRT